MQESRVETAALASDMESVSAHKGILELSVKVIIHNIKRLHIHMFNRVYVVFLCVIFSE